MKGEKNVEVGKDMHTWEGAEGEERFPYLGRSPHGREISWDRKGASEAQKIAQQPVCGRQDRVRLTQRVSTTTLCTPA